MGGEKDELITRNEVRLKGDHNLENVMAALALGPHAAQTLRQCEVRSGIFRVSSIGSSSLQAFVELISTTIRRRPTSMQRSRRWNLSKFPLS